MKFLHLSDLHLGKRLHECPLLEDQAHILDEILRIAEKQRPDAVIIAGDVYDKPVPPAEAVQLFDRFLTGLAALGCTVLLTSGNHDSAERVAFGAQLLQKGGVYISPPYSAAIRPVTLRDADGEVDFWLLPFLKPSTVRHVWGGNALPDTEMPDGKKPAPADANPQAAAPGAAQAEKTACRGGQAPSRANALPDGRLCSAAAAGAAAALQADGTGNAGAGVLPEGFGPQKAALFPPDLSAGALPLAEKGNVPETAAVGTGEPPVSPFSSYDTAVRYAVARLPRRPGVRCVLAAHQFVTGAARCDSEEVSVGGVDNVDVSAFEGFDYVALGHIHSPQSVGRPTVRYCGAPLKYSFSEAEQQKSVTLVQLGPGGQAAVTALPLKPLREVRRLRGSYLALTDPANYRGTATEDYLQITLTDEEEVPEAVGRLRSVYPNLLRLEYDNRRTRGSQRVNGAETIEKKTPLEHFAALYQLQNNQPMSGEQAAFCQKLIQEIWEQGGTDGCGL